MAESIAINGATLRVKQGDLTREAADAIVNAANSGLMGGGGVDGAIHRAGGPAILEECRKIVAARGRLPAGQAVITTAGKMPAKHVIHTVGPVWRGGESGEPGLLASAYRESLKLAAAEGLASIAFPAISAGIYGYPMKEAAAIAAGTAADFLKTPSTVKDVVFVLYNETAYDAFRKALENLKQENGQ
jgi:O-acetyl-ADP-ribose deacetylase (regulator of RNase III)